MASGSCSLGCLLGFSLLAPETGPQAELPSDPSIRFRHPTASLTASVPGCLTGIFSILTRQSTTLSFPPEKLLPTSAISAASICLLKADVAASLARTPLPTPPPPELIPHRRRPRTAAAASSRASPLLYSHSASPGMWSITSPSSGPSSLPAASAPSIGCLRPLHRSAPTSPHGRLP